MELEVKVERWPLRYPLRIARYSWEYTDALVVDLSSNGVHGRGECAGVYYRDDSLERCRADIERVADAVRAGIRRTDLLDLLPAGGARNALDCALWELESRLRGKPVWELAGLHAPRPLVTTFTLGADEPIVMAERARAFSSARALKLKLTGDGLDAERVVAVRMARPTVWLAVDANQGFTRESLAQLMPTLVEARVKLIEQPFPVERDVDMEGLRSPIPVAADESAQDTSDLAALAGRFDIVNIKLDKCGGLTSALAMAVESRRLGLGVMVGNMCGTSLAMAPGFVLGQSCDIVDLDGPLLLAADRPVRASYDEGFIWCSESVWGAY